MATISERVTTHCIYLVGASSVPPISRPVPSGARPPPCPPGTGHTQMGPSILRSHCYSKYSVPYPFARCGVTMPSHSWALLPVLLLLSLLLPVAAEWRMEKQRAGEASCYIECRIRGKLHSLPSPSPWPAYRSFYPTSPFSLRFSEKV